MTLFDKIEYYQASIIVIQTMNNSVFGAFCSQPWSDRIKPNERRAKYFGNGETFLFEISPEPRKYEWVGKLDGGNNTTANQELFLYADLNHLIVGGSGSDQHGPGLLINSSLINGRTTVSDTFKNEILGTEEFFDIATLEVFSFESV